MDYLHGKKIYVSEVKASYFERGAIFKTYILFHTARAPEAYLVIIRVLLSLRQFFVLSKEVD